MDPLPITMKKLPSEQVKAALWLKSAKTADCPTCQGNMVTFLEKVINVLRQLLIQGQENGRQPAPYRLAHATNAKTALL